MLWSNKLVPVNTYDTAVRNSSSLTLFSVHDIFTLPTIIHF